MYSDEIVEIFLAHAKKIFEGQKVLCINISKQFPFDRIDANIYTNV